MFAQRWFSCTRNIFPVAGRRPLSQFNRTVTKLNYPQIWNFLKSAVVRPEVYTENTSIDPLHARRRRKIVRPWMRPDFCTSSTTDFLAFGQARRGLNKISSSDVYVSSKVVSQITLRSTGKASCVSEKKQSRNKKNCPRNGCENEGKKSNCNKPFIACLFTIRPANKSQ